MRVFSGRSGQGSPTSSTVFGREDTGGTSLRTDGSVVLKGAGRAEDGREGRRRGRGRGGGRTAAARPWRRRRELSLSMREKMKCFFPFSTRKNDVDVHEDAFRMQLSEPRTPADGRNAERERTRKTGGGAENKNKKWRVTHCHAFRPCPDAGGRLPPQVSPPPSRSCEKVGCTGGVEPSKLGCGSRVITL